MKKIYKYLLLVVAVAIIIGVSVTSSSAMELIGSGMCGEDVMWELTSDVTLTISGSGEMDNFHPGDSPWYNTREDVCNVIISSGVTNIGANAFLNCSNLSNVDISDTVTIIGERAFAECANLTEITIPQNVTTIYSGVLEGCTSLEELTVPKTAYGDSIDSKFGWIFGYQEKEETMYYGSYDTQHTVNGSYDYPAERYPQINQEYTDGTEVPQGAVYQNYNRTYTSHKYVGNGIYDCYSHRVYVYYNIPESLKKVKITNEESIGDAFYNCANIEEIILSKATTEIGEKAFFGASNLKKIYIPKSVTRIDRYAFNGCDNFLVYYAGTKEEWNEVAIAYDNDALLNASFCYECYMGLGFDITPLSATTTEIGVNYTRFYVNFEKGITGAIIIVTVVGKNGKPEHIKTENCDGRSNYTITIPLLTASKTAKVFVWGTDNTDPEGVSETIYIG